MCHGWNRPSFFPSCTLATAFSVEVKLYHFAWYVWIIHLKNSQNFFLKKGALLVSKKSKMMHVVCRISSFSTCQRQHPFLTFWTERTSISNSLNWEHPFLILNWEHPFLTFWTERHLPTPLQISSTIFSLAAVLGLADNSSRGQKARPPHCSERQADSQQPRRCYTIVLVIKAGCDMTRIQHVTATLTPAPEWQWSASRQGNGDGGWHGMISSVH